MTPVSLYKVGGWLLLTLLACLGNYFALPILFGVDLLFGSIFIYLLLFYYGLPLTFLAAVPAYFLTQLLWGHYWGLAAYLLELIFVAGLLHYLRFRELPLVVAVYWLLIGIPSGLLTYHQWLDLQWLQAWMVVSKQGLNALVNATLTLTLIYLLPNQMGLRKRPELSMSDLFFYLPTLMLVLGSLLMVVLTGHYQTQRAHTEILRQLQGMQQLVSLQLDEQLQRVHRQLQEFHSHCRRPLQTLPDERQCFDGHLITSALESLFLRPMAGQHWQPLSSLSPSTFYPQALEEDLNAAIKKLQESGQNQTQYLTSSGQLLLLRRAFHDDFHQDWLAGLVKMESFHPINLLTRSQPNSGYVWHHQNQPVITLRAYAQESKGLTQALSATGLGELHHWIPEQGVTAVGRWGRSIFYLEEPLAALGADLPGSLRVELMPNQFQEDLFRGYALLFSIAFGLILVGILITRLVSSWIARPINDLIQVAANLPNQLPLPISSWRWAKPHPLIEINQLGEQLGKMGRLLKHQFSELENKEQRLEELVAQRTRELVDAHQHLQSVIDSMEAVLWSAEISENQGKQRLRLSFISPSVVQMTGFTPRAWLMNTPGLIKEGMEAKEANKVLTEMRSMVTKGRGRLTLQFRHPRSDSQRVLTLRYWLVYSSQGLPERVDGLITDSTEAYRAEERVKEQEQLLLHQSRRAAMGEMISNIAHQWRQPLNSLRLTLGNLKDARDYGDLTEDLFDENLQQADQLIDQMNQTVRDFVTFFRPRKEAEIFYLARVVEQAVDVMKASLQEMQLHLDLDTRLAIKGYANEVLQVILVILQNAREAINNYPGLKGELWISLRQDADRVLLTLEDNAGGIPAEVMSQVFDPYFTTKAEGSGIGLYMAKMVIENQMQGGLQASNGERGAVFILSFPLQAT